MVSDVFMPPISLLMGGVDFANLFLTLKEGAGPYHALADAQAAGAVTINYGILFNSIISFLIVVFAVFLVIRNINKMKKEEKAPPEEPTTKECGLCQMTILIKATKCGHCTAELKATV